MNKRYFLIPENVSSGDLLRLLWSIPKDWCWVDGGLRAPQSMIDAGETADHTGYEMDRYFKKNLSIESSDKELRPDLHAIVVEGKRPEFVRFDTVGDNQELFDRGMRLVHGFISVGYRGWLSFFSGYVNNEKYANPARCAMNLLPWSGAPFMDEEAGPQPPRILVEWSERYGREELLTPIIIACKEIGFPEYDPKFRKQVA